MSTRGRRGGGRKSCYCTKPTVLLHICRIVIVLFLAQRGDVFFFLSIANLELKYLFNQNVRYVIHLHCCLRKNELNKMRSMLNIFWRCESHIVARKTLCYCTTLRVLLHFPGHRGRRGSGWKWWGLRELGVVSFLWPSFDQCEGLVLAHERGRGIE